MALKANQRQVHANPIRYRGGATQRMEVADSNKADFRNSYGVFDKTASVPNGYNGSMVWIMPMKEGAMSSYKKVLGYSESNITVSDLRQIELVGSSESVGDVFVGATGYMDMQTSASADTAMTISSILNMNGSSFASSTSSFVIGASANLFMNLSVSSSSYGSLIAISFIFGSEIRDDQITTTSISEAVWSHSAGVKVKNNSSLIPALL
jgi:hypothetical protein